MKCKGPLTWLGTLFCKGKLTIKLNVTLTIKLFTECTCVLPFRCLYLVLERRPGLNRAILEVILCFVLDNITFYRPLHCFYLLVVL